LNKKAITMPELEEARDKVRWGRERRSLAMTDEEKRNTAWHEAGHALVNVLLEHTHPLHKVTIIPRGQSLGSTMSLPKEDVLNRRRKEMLDMIAMIMAGRIAEEISSSDISTGAAADIQQATQLARAMVCQWGMSERLGMVQYGDNNEYIFLGREMIRSKDYSEQTAQEIDAEVKRLIDEGYQRARAIIGANRDKLEVLAKALLEYETLEGSQVEAIIRTGEFVPREPLSTSTQAGGSQVSPPVPETSKPPPLDAGLSQPAPATI
jgi:cell division protease FtsH